MRRKPPPLPTTAAGIHVPNMIRGRRCIELWGSDATMFTAFRRGSDLFRSWASNDLGIHPEWTFTLKAAIGDPEVIYSRAPWSITSVNADFLQRLGLPADWDPSRESPPDPIPTPKPEHRLYCIDPMNPARR